MLIRKIIIGLLSFYAVEIQRSSLRETHTPYNEVSIEWSYETKKRKEKKKTKSYDNNKWKKQQRFKEPNVKIRGTNPKDVRFSNQKMIRRMFRNS